jgi:hypothetical protein
VTAVSWKKFILIWKTKLPLSTKNNGGIYPQNERPNQAIKSDCSDLKIEECRSFAVVCKTTWCL